MRCYLYIVRHGDDRWDLHKIGVAANVDARISQLQTGNPFWLELVRVVPFPDRAKALAAERGMHTMLEAQSALGEWFGGPYEDILAALSLVLMDTPAEMQLA